MTLQLKKGMVALDPTVKVQLNEIKSILLKNKSTQPNATRSTSYRAIVKMSVEELHKKMLKRNPQEPTPTENQTQPSGVETQ